jgi:rubrerythrin
MTDLLNGIVERDETPSGMLSVIFSNYAQACTKIMQPELSTLFTLLHRSLEIQAAADRAQEMEGEKSEQLLEDFQDILQADRSRYEEGEREALESGDRGALRNFTWGKKVTAIQSALIKRFHKSGGGLLKENERLFVCQACGFVGIGVEAPDSCPVCKAPQSRFASID